MRKIPTMAIAAILMFASCSDETTVFSDATEDIILETNQSVLDQSISFENAGVLDIFADETLSGKSSKSSAIEEAGDYPLTLVATIASPTYNGTLLTAAHIDVDGDYAFVSYNTSGNDYLGAVDVINIADPTSPVLTSRLLYADADINSITYDNGYVYAAGGIDAELSTLATSNSFISKIAISGGIMSTSDVSYIFQEGFNATDVKVMDDKLIVTSGKDGYLNVYDKNSLVISQEMPLADLRALAIRNNEIAVLDASKGVSILDQNLNSLKEISISSDFGDYAKRTLDFYDDNIVVAEGSKGAGVYNAASGNLVEYVPILINPEGVETSNIVTNAVAVNEGVVLMANGGAGLCLSEDTGNNTDLVGIIELDGSINYVVSKGDYVLAASGKAGLQIIKLNKPSLSLEAQCASTPEFNGSNSVFVDTGEVKAFSGSKRLNKITNHGELLLCGSWTVKNHVDVKIDALFEMYGNIVVGNNKGRQDITVSSGATFVVEGGLTIYGDLILKDGATIEFLGSDSVANIFGNVIKDGNVNVIGTFRDVRNKF